MSTGPTAAQLEQRLRERLAPSKLEVLDESFQHDGHAGAKQPVGEVVDAEHIGADAARDDNRQQQGDGQRHQGVERHPDRVARDNLRARP